MNRNTDPTAASLADHAHPADIALMIRAVELGTLSAAARERNVPVSQVSRAIDRLEQAYGVRLLRRSTHGLSVTPEGELMLAHGREALTTLTNLADQLAKGTRSAAGPVRLAVSVAMAVQLIVPALPALRAKHPALRLELLADDRMADLPTEGIDVALRTGIVANDSLVAREVGSFGRALYCSPAYRSRHGEPATPDELHQHTLITHMAAGHLNRWPFRVERKRIEMTVAGGFSASNSLLAGQMACQGLGIARISLPLAAEWVKRGELVEVLAAHRDPTVLPVYAVMLPDRQRLPRIRAVVDWLAQLMAASAWAR